MFRRYLINSLYNNSRIVSHFHTPTATVAHKATPTNTTTPNDFVLEQKHIDEAIRVVPNLSTISPELWRRAHETFANHGLNTSNFLRIVTGNPAVLTRSPQKNIECLENWRSCQFGESFLYLLITKYPELLNLTDRRHLLTHVTFLKSFVSSNKNVWRLLMNCPNLLKQSEAQIKQKLAYLQQEMRIEVPEIAKCEALAKPLADIRCRHVFLMRLGLFIPRSPKADENEPTKNPRLYKITDTSEKAFATKVCHVTLAEFEAFKELYARERNQQEIDGDEDEDEQDENENSIDIKL